MRNIKIVRMGDTPEYLIVVGEDMMHAIKVTPLEILVLKKEIEVGEKQFLEEMNEEEKEEIKEI